MKRLRTVVTVMLIMLVTTVYVAGDASHGVSNLFSLDTRDTVFVPATIEIGVAYDVSDLFSLDTRDVEVISGIGFGESNVFTLDTREITVDSLIDVIIPDTVLTFTNRILVPVIVLDDLTGKSIDEYEFELSYDSSVLRFIGADWSTSEIINGNSMSIEYEAEDGVIEVEAEAEDSDYLAGSGKLLDLIFTPASTFNTSKQVTFSWIEFEFNEDDLDVQTGDGTITFNFMHGDCDRDYVVAVTDAVCVLQCIVGMNSFDQVQTLLADVTGNGTISAYDASLILQYVVNIIDSFPAQSMSKTIAYPQVENFELSGQYDNGLYTLTFDLGKTSGVFAFESEIKYDYALLRFVSVNSGDSFIESFDNTGRLKIAVADMNELSGNTISVVFESKNSLLAAPEITSMILNEIRIDDTKLHDLDITVPEEYAILLNYPNPFNPETQISFSIPESGMTTLRIYNTLGQHIRTLVHKDMAAGNYTIGWNGRNSAGVSVNSGIYLCDLQARNFSRSIKMILLK